MAPEVAATALHGPPPEPGLDELLEGTGAVKEKKVVEPDQTIFIFKKWTDVLEFIGYTVRD